MQQIRTHFAFIALALLCLTISLSACQKPSDSKGSAAATPASPKTPAAPPTESGGGIDGSGGDVLQSTLEQVQKAFDESINNLDQTIYAIHRMHKLDQETYDYMFEKGAHTLVGAFLDPKRTNESSPEMADSIAQGKIRILAKNEDCKTSDASHDGSAIGDHKSGTICLSLTRLQKIPVKSLNEEIFLLLIHELSHLSGFNENQAVALQKLFSRNPNLYEDGLIKTYSVSGFRRCNIDEMFAEQKEMENSPYWQRQKEILVELLSDSQPRGCGPSTNEMTDKVDIFADDAEFLNTTGKFSRQEFKWELTSQARGIEGTFYSSSNIQDLTNVASVHLETKSAVIWGINGKIGTNAQCSTKALVANLIANIPTILKTNCGRGAGDSLDNISLEQREAKMLEGIKARVLKEKEILEGEKSSSPLN